MKGKEKLIQRLSWAVFAVAILIVAVVGGDQAAHGIYGYSVIGLCSIAIIMRLYLLMNKK